MSKVSTFGYPVNAKGKRICNSPKRMSEDLCESTFLYPNGRCRLHGGEALKGPAHPNFKDGHRSKHFYMPKRLSLRTEQLVGDAIENLEMSISIQKGLETDLLEKLDTNESLEAWLALSKLLNELDKPADKGGIGVGQFVEGVREIVGGAITQASLHRQIQSIHETQRKLTESVTKCRKEVQETWTNEQFQQIMKVVQSELRAVVAPDQVTHFLTRVFANIDGPKQLTA